MRELARSMLSLSWAIPLWGAERLVRLPGAGAGAADALDALSSVARRQMGLPLQMVFQAGDDLQRHWIDIFADGLTPEGVRGSLTAATAAPVEALRFLGTGPAGQASRVELANKLEVYRLVRGVRKLLALPAPGVPFVLEDYVARAERLTPRRALWAFEGLGHDYTALALARDPSPRGLLAAADLPAASLVLLHAGLGMALAEKLLAELGPASPPAAVRGVLERFTALCHDNARDGYAQAALESLGLMTRCFFPELVAVIDRELEATRGYFWHGAGRALYFLPVSFVPGYTSIRHALATAAREAPRAEARDNAVAGVAYAATMVNMAHPIVLESFLVENGGHLPASFVEGLISSVLLRHRTTPTDPDLAAFLAHRGVSASPWNHVVSAPLTAALEDDGVVGTSAVYRTLVGDSELAQNGGRPGGAAS